MWCKWNVCRGSSHSADGGRDAGQRHASLSKNSKAVPAVMFSRCTEMIGRHTSWFERRLALKRDVSPFIWRYFSWRSSIAEEHIPRTLLRPAKCDSWWKKEEEIISAIHVTVVTWIERSFFGGDSSGKTREQYLQKKIRQHAISFHCYAGEC